MGVVSPIAGVDVGGTKILAALADEKGKILATEYVPTNGEAGPQAGLKRVADAVAQVCRKVGVDSGNLRGCGIAIAGLVNAAKGTLSTSPHLPGWMDVPIRSQLEASLRAPTFVINDAKAAAIGEQRFGAGQGVSHQIYVTVSTGIGGGIIIDGRLYSGCGGTAGEIGHMVIDTSGPRCECGNNGCLESLAAGTAIAREASQRMAAGEATLLRDMVNGQLERITAQVVAQAAERGDALADNVIRRAGVYLGVGLANLVNIFNPELIVIGGGTAKIGDRLLGPALTEMRRRAFSKPASEVKIVPAGLGDNSGVLGAVAYVLQETTRRR